jgi:Coenzyme PQQ synthesis protein D (PqqD)
MPDPLKAETDIDEHSRITVPAHVVHRTFVTETVVLNIESGQYHGLNTTAGRMLETVEHHGTIAASVEPLAAEFGVPAERIRTDLLELCKGLHARGLIEARGDGG